MAIPSSTISALPQIIQIQPTGDGNYVLVAAFIAAAIGLVIAAVQIWFSLKLSKKQQLFAAKSGAYRDFLALITKTHEDRRLHIWFPDITKEEDRKKLHDHLAPINLFQGKVLASKILVLIKLFKEPPPDTDEDDFRILQGIREVIQEMRRELELEDFYDFSENKPKRKAD